MDKETMHALKEVVYTRIIEYLDIEGYPTEGTLDFKVANISDLVLYTIGPILQHVRKMGRNIRLTREKVIASVDDEAGGNEEFVVMDWIVIGDDKFVLVVEAKRTSTRKGKKQILLAMKDAWENNTGGVIYGFVTTGEDWRMLTYDGAEFMMINKLTVVFNMMEEEKEKWMKENSLYGCCID